MKKYIAAALALCLLLALAGCAAPKTQESAAPDMAKLTYTEEAVTVQADPTMPLDGLLTLPDGVEKPPVVILVQGSGVSDKNEEITGNKPFEDIAHGLAEQGIATLRYDKRHYVYPENAQTLGGELTLRDEALDDVDAAIAMMEADERVNGQKVFVLGHSLGGMLVPVIASEHPELAGVISMAGTLRTLYEVMYDQSQEAYANLDSSELSDSDKELVESQMATIEKDIVTLRGDISDLPNDTILLGVPVGYWKSIKEMNGMNYIDSVTMPMLILQGSADFQVYADKDYALWVDTLKDRTNVVCTEFEGLNHLMMPTQGKRDLSEYVVVSHVSQDVINSIADFVHIYAE